MQVDVFFTPEEYRLASEKGKVVVVIDVLRATTCMVAAFVNGCDRVVPVKTVEEAFARRKAIFGAVLAGERLGLIVPGFDIGNSPLEYTKERMKGKTVIITTTNGTRALYCAAAAESVYIAAFTNAAAVCRKLKEAERDVVILCAGSEGRLSVEDSLCAGMIVDFLAEEAVLSDKALVVRAMYHGSREQLVKVIMSSSHAQYLIGKGFIADIEFCLRRNISEVAPRFSHGFVDVQK